MNTTHILSTIASTLILSITLLGAPANQDSSLIIYPRIGTTVTTATPIVIGLVRDAALKPVAQERVLLKINDKRSPISVQIVMGYGHTAFNQHKHSMLDGIQSTLLPRKPIFPYKAAYLMLFLVVLNCQKINTAPATSAQLIHQLPILIPAVL